MTPPRSRLRKGTGLIAGAFLLLALVVLGGACRRDAPPPSQRELLDRGSYEIAATTAVLQSWANDLLQGSPLVLRPFDLTGAGPETPVSPTERAYLSRTQVLIAHGGRVDTRLVNAFREAAPGRPVITTAPGDALLGYWFDPDAAEQSLAALSRELGELFPQRAGSIDARRAALATRMRAAHEQASEVVRDFAGQPALGSDPRMRPAIRALGFQPEATAAGRPHQAPTAEDLDAFFAAAGRIDHPVLWTFPGNVPNTIRERAAESGIRTLTLSAGLTGSGLAGDFEAMLAGNATMARLVYGLRAQSLSGPAE